ncbi:glycosyltransferase family 2 protein [Streptacidiphilus melanogenes]|uniref:glycosyltransferase family 2 protein n=1 Tax=Streptacidiphilus melanogenes TaxID=411235 RepID=UPI0005A656A4|nr:glycosyltransferase [Streptacidiphilus melanogenes]
MYETREDISLVIPAHNEERVVGRLLDALLVGGADGLDIVVVCNGCTDGTAQAARSRGPAVRVVELEQPSKHRALRVGDEHAKGFPRIYVDADVVLSGADARRVAAALDAPGVLASAPERELPLDASDWRVRAFYRVWLRLPTVRQGLFGRGVVGVSEEGHARLVALPELMADDLAFSLAFSPEERQVVAEARAVIQPPRNWPDLMRRRIRAMTSTVQLEHHQRTSGTPAHGDSAASARTSLGDLRALVRAEPSLLPSVAVFAATAVLARRAARRAIRAGDFATWLRDESSRS